MKKMKLMLVDDEERFLSTTKKILAKKGYDVMTSASGTEAIEALKSHEIHVVILDVKMPGMNGIEVLKEIKKHYPMVEVIMLTGHATVDSAVEGMKTGAVDYLVKPCDIDELLEKAEEAYEKRRKIEEKIRSAQARTYMKSPREILKKSAESDE